VLQLQTQLAQLEPHDPQYAARFVDVMLAAAERLGASDIHLLPGPTTLEIKLRRDGVLATVGAFPNGVAASVITRLKVLAELLTYRTDTPQEGRLRRGNSALEMRVSTLPTLHGERVAIRLFASDTKLRLLSDLKLDSEITAALQRELRETSGLIIVAGPAGSGKTTTLYACLRELAHESPARSIVTLEDPIEMELSGVAQSQVNAAAGYELLAGLRAVVRQDPEVILVGEMRDAPTAEVALQASLTGQLVLTSFHAPSAPAALGRLADMDIPPFVIRSGVRAILAQRLVRQLCVCARETTGATELLNWPVKSARVPVGCDQCSQTGYRGRMVLCEWLDVAKPAVGRAVLDQRPVQELFLAATLAGMVSLAEQGISQLIAGHTSPAELRRVLGWNDLS
jgi:type II secretory ATPase GspE/PulE/Tfp pilus assembly ATPase PilB-like protein